MKFTIHSIFEYIHAFSKIYQKALTQSTRTVIHSNSRTNNIQKYHIN